MTAPPVSPGDHGPRQLYARPGLHLDDAGAGRRRPLSPGMMRPPVPVASPRQSHADACEMAYDHYAAMRRVAWD